ncbi:protein of unknown function [Xenorhabdus doucetiae]|uniref:HK97 family phage major capsid protein n=1 Tax=Xenorhabdus doucetiae TaxID=351671 RepID=A0A068QWK1_9GAMM|nr:HK97 family phage major capsid protein [Xenorhabdus doucetiae]CDG19041.1 protein of unknown function [Xenorhabdus doucetiae]
MRTLLTKAENEKCSLNADEAKQFDELRHYIVTGETRALSTGVLSEGGYTVIPKLNKQIMQQLTCESVMRRIPKPTKPALSAPCKSWKLSALRPIA